MGGRDARGAVAGRSRHSKRLNRSVYIVLDAWENEPFLAKFKDVPEVALDWPAMVEAGTSHRTRLWRVGDRARFLAGENLQHDPSAVTANQS